MTKLLPSRAKTIKEVALAADVSVATVSRTLANPGIVSPHTRERVQAAVDRLNYTPNIQARNLRTSKTRLIVALIPDVTNPFFSGVIRGIEQVAYKNRYSVLLGDTNFDLTREKEYADLLSAKQADGLITLSPRIPVLRLGGRLPIVNACEYVTDPDITSVFVDNVKAASRATDYLISLGHKRIAFISGPGNSPISNDRERGYREALHQAGLKFDRKLFAHGDYSFESGVRGVESIISHGTQFSAVFCCSDEMAIGAIRAMRNRNMVVPDDVSVVGFDDIQMAKYCDPTLTTVAQPKEELGREAMLLLLEILGGTDPPPRKLVLETELVIRGSTSRFKRG